MHLTTNKYASTDAPNSVAPIEPGESGSVLPEFGRVPDVERIYGIKRGLCYQLIASGAIKSVCLRRPGAQTGVRLIQLSSVRALLNANLEGSVK